LITDFKKLDPEMLSSISKIVKAVVD